MIEKISNEICDSLSKIETDIENLSINKSKSIIHHFLYKNQHEWNRELNEYKNKTSNDEYHFDQYFQHFTLSKCKNFRILFNKIDRYLEDTKELVPIYLKTKDFIFMLEDNSPNEKLLEYFNVNFEEKTLAQLKRKISNIKLYSSLSIVLTGSDYYTFVVRYFDYKTNENLYQLDISFKNSSSTTIDKIETKNKKQIKKELKRMKKFYKDVENGDAEIPTPPPPPFNN